MKGFTTDRMHPLLNLLLLVGLIAAGMSVGMFVALAISGAAYGVSFSTLPVVLSNPSHYSYGWSVLMLMQGLSLLLGFGGGAVGVALVNRQAPVPYFAPRRPAPFWWLLAAMALILVSIPALSALVAWNAGVHLPTTFQWLEQKARASEDQAQGLTTFLTQFTTATRFWVAMLVVAVIPAIAEELTFRGIVQRQIIRFTGSMHWGVWLSAIIFSAVHMQFFGFVPRVVLGVLLGYLYAWSGNILVPMAAHFAQNALQLIMLYYQQHNWTTTLDPDSTEAMPWPYMLVSLGLTAGLIIVLQRRFAVPIAPPTEMHTLSSKGVAAIDLEVAGARGRTINSKGIDTSRETAGL
ncbi:CPBP family intramembrane glutamic endopeptidase [Hymenobacter jejuensis]|uniref:CPBP family intramembrane metalloprotease n=1 Tax=Hymenobacter jejuensis TaxID=2502781 RepID=A0A5B7ZYR4_9BACT|nr:CPBP family intramembrane glutamic endopeptidase [Hymenobacter jejuensis]QDA59979.1 CPBP family intramembrane metalloprotease [Hymenobacter jejuensis]